MRTPQQTAMLYGDYELSQSQLALVLEQYAAQLQAQLKAADGLAAAWERLRHYVGHHDGCPELRAGKCSCGVHERVIALNAAEKAYLRLREPVQAQAAIPQDEGAQKPATCRYVVGRAGPSFSPILCGAPMPCATHSKENA